MIVLLAPGSSASKKRSGWRGGISPYTASIWCGSGSTADKCTAEEWIEEIGVLDAASLGHEAEQMVVRIEGPGAPGGFAPRHGASSPRAPAVPPTGTSTTILRPLSSSIGAGGASCGTSAPSKGCAQASTARWRSPEGSCTAGTAVSAPTSVGSCARSFGRVARRAALRSPKQRAVVWTWCSATTIRACRSNASPASSVWSSIESPMLSYRARQPRTEQPQDWGAHRGAEPQVGRAAGVETSPSMRPERYGTSDVREGSLEDSLELASSRFVKL